MLPFISIIVAVLAMIAMAYTITSDEKLYRFTSVPYNKDKHAVFEVRSKTYEHAKEAAIEMMTIYQSKVGQQLRWELIEEIDPKTKEVMVIMYKLPELEKQEA
jgi:hypothetical protein